MIINICRKRLVTMASVTINCYHPIVTFYFVYIKYGKGGQIFHPPKRP